MGREASVGLIRLDPAPAEVKLGQSGSCVCMTSLEKRSKVEPFLS